MKNKIFMRVMSAKSAESLKTEFPIDRKLDFAVGYRVLGENENGIKISKPFSNKDLEESGLKKEELYALALENTKSLFKTNLYPLGSLVRRICDGTEAEDLYEGEGKEGNLDSSEIYVLTNESGMFGASVMLQDQILRRVSERLGYPIYVLPSSVHEILIVPKTEDYDPKLLKETVEGVNSTVVSEYDFLSDSVYEFDVQNGIRICDIEAKAEAI